MTTQSPAPTFADLVTVTGYGLGLWWAFGGPTWAGVSSVVLDELDGRIARAMGQTSERGSALDWGADVSLTAVSALRLGQATGQPVAALASAPVLLYGQAHLRGQGYRPPLGSARAVLMLATMAVEAYGKKR